MENDLDKLQGTWNIISIEADGDKMPIASVDGAKIIVTGSNFKSLGMGAVYEGTVELDEKKLPKTFNLHFTVGHAAGTRHVGIYKLRGNKWTICLATTGTRRPREFATKAGSGLVLESLERDCIARSTKDVKPGPKRVAKSSKHADKKTHATQSGAATELEGEWAMLAGVFNGAALRQDMVDWCRRITRGNVTSVMAGPQTMLKATFTLDQSKNPAAIDYINLEGSNKGKRQAGIFELTGDTLKVCIAAPGRPRPADFTSKPSDGRSYTQWRLTKK